MKIDVAQTVGAVVREVRDVVHDAKPAKMVVATRTYDTDIDDLWDALTNGERIPRWFLPVSGDLRLGGHYKFEGNAGGSIERCEKPSLLAVTWESGPMVSWLTLHLSKHGDGTELTLEHTAHVPPQMWDQFGPGAVGVGWDGGFMGLGRHLENPNATGGPADGAAWAATGEGKAFYRACSEAWCEAAIAAGTDPAAARAAADRTTAFYTGGEHKD
jgi:uncharacterized protein YndB with AHSA1/START domain